MNIDALICARWVIPVEPEVTALEHHAVAVDRGRILDVLPVDAARARYTALETHELDSHVVMPGLVNAHTHAPMTLFRGMADDLPLMSWLNDHIWPAEQQWVSPEFVTDGTRLAIAEMIRGGTTCFSDMYFFSEQIAETAIEARMRAVVGMIFIDFPTGYAKDADEYFQKGERLHDKLKHNPLISTAFAPHSPYAVSDGPLRRIATLAEELDIPVHMHVNETADEVERSVEQHGKKPLQRIAELGLLGPRLIAVHMTQLDWEDIELVAKNGVHVAHCPESNMKLASGFCPVQNLVNAGVNVVIGTDGAASNNDLDMIGEIRTAALLAKGVAGDPRALPAPTALSMATIGAARALGLDREIGSLVRNKQADIIAIDLDAPETQPLYDPVSQVIYAAARHQVTDVWIAGEPVMSRRVLLSVDVEAANARAAVWHSRIRPSNGLGA